MPRMKTAVGFAPAPLNTTTAPCGVTRLSVTCTSSGAAGAASSVLSAAGLSLLAMDLSLPGASLASGFFASAVFWTGLTVSAFAILVSAGAAVAGATGVLFPFNRSAVLMIAAAWALVIAALIAVAWGFSVPGGT